jgi:hypothetical protein
MGRGAEILVLPLGAMALLSIGAVFAAFFSRTAAKVCAGVAVGLAALLLLVILAENRWDLAWLLFLLREATPPILVIYGSVILSVVAVAVPLRRPGAVRPDGERTPARPRWILFALALGITLAGAVYGIAQLAEGRRGEEKTRALLSGDANVRLQRIQIDYHQQRVICTDPEVLRYLEERFRRHEPEPDFLGTTYQLSLTYDGGGTQAFASYWTDTGDFNLFLGEPGEGGKGHGIRLTHPRPRGVEELITFLVKSHRDVAGSVLILEAGGTRMERDESLVAR